MENQKKKKVLWWKFGEWNKENVENLKCNEKLTCWLHAHWSSSISCQAQELLCNTSHVNFSTQAHFAIWEICYTICAMAKKKNKMCKNEKKTTMKQNKK